MEDAHDFAAGLARGPRSLGLIKRQMVRNGLGDVQAGSTTKPTCKPSRATAPTSSKA